MRLSFPKHFTTVLPQMADDSYDFDQAIDRRSTGSLKWDLYESSGTLPFWVADMDFAAPPEVIAALEQRVRHGIYGYTAPYPEVIDAFLAYLERDHRVRAEAEWLIWFPGMVPALNVICRALGNSGDRVMTCTPVYPPFLSAPAYSDRELVAVPMTLLRDRWTFDFDAMEKQVTPRTRLFILCNPHNPVGSVFRREELNRLVNFCEQNDIILCSDEIHCDLILDDVAHVSWLAQGETANARGITLMAPSKTYNLPGLCCALAVIPDPKVRARVRRAAAGIITEVNAFGYAGCSAAYRYGEPWRQQLLAYLRQNRDVLYTFVRERLPAIKLYPMEATYLAWMDLRALGIDNPAAFFESAGVGLSDGTAFNAPGYLRFNFGCPRKRMLEGLERMAQAVDSR